MRGSERCLWRGASSEKEGFNVDGLYVNRNWSPFSLWSVVAATFAVTLEMCVTLLFVGGFLLLQYQEVDAVSLLLLVGSLSCCSLLAVFGISLLRVVRDSVTLLATLYLLTPVLASLVRPVSDDTVAFIVVVLLLIHVVSYDYFSSRAYSEFTTLVSTNSGLLSAVFLCSRLSSHVQVFGTMSLSLAMFVLLPMVLSKLRAHSLAFYRVLAIVVAPAVTVAFFVAFLWNREPQYLKLFGWLFGSWLGLTNVLGPLLFHRMQRIKTILDGQWAEAKVGRVFYPSPSTTTQQSWSLASSWLGLEVPCSQNDSVVELALVRGFPQLLVDDGLRDCSLGTVIFGNETSSSLLIFGSSQREAGLLFRAQKLVFSQGGISVPKQDFPALVEADFVEVTPHSDCTVLAQGLLPSLGELRTTAMSLKSSTFGMRGVNLTCHGNLTMEQSILGFGGTGFALGTVWMDGSSQFQLFTSVDASLSSITGGTVSGGVVSLELSTAAVFDHVSLVGTSDDDPFSLVVHEQVKFRNNISFSYVRLDAVAENMDEAPFLVEAGSHVVFSLTFLRTASSKVMTIVASTVKIEPEMTLEIDTGEMTMSQSKFNMGHYSTLVVQGTGLLTLTDVAKIGGDKDDEYGGSTINVVGGQFSLGAGSEETFTCAPLLELAGGTFLSLGTFPSKLFMVGGLELLSTVQPASFTAFHADLVVSDLTFAGGRTFSKTLAASNIAVYDGGNSIEASTVNVFSQLTFSDAGSLSVNGDLVMQNRSVLQWEDDPAGQTQLTIAGNFFCGDAVVLNMSSVKIAASGSSSFLLVSWGGWVGKPMQLVAPHGWVLNMTQGGVMLTRMFQPISSTLSTQGTQTTWSSTTAPGRTSGPGYVGIIVGASIGGAVLLAFVIVVAVCVVRVRRNRERGRFIDELGSVNEQASLIDAK